MGIEINGRVEKRGAELVDSLGGMTREFVREVAGVVIRYHCRPHANVAAVEDCRGETQI